MGLMPPGGADLSGTPARPRRARWKLVLLVVVLLLVAGELVVRAFGLVDVSAGTRTPEQAEFNQAGLFVAVDDPDISYRNRPLARAVVAGIEYEHDALGRRVLPAPPAGDGLPVVEVAFFGDSTCYGLGLPAEETLPALVQTALAGRVRALNHGTCGYNVGQEAALYASERRSLEATRLVVLLVFPNDFAPGTFLWDEGLKVMYVDPLPLPRSVKPWLWRSALYRALVSWRGSTLREAGVYDPLRRENHAVALAAVERLAVAALADDKQVLVAHLPAMESLDPYLFADAADELRARCGGLGVPYVDLLEPFLIERERQVAEHEARGGAPVTAEQRAGFLGQYWIGRDDHHLNAAGNRVAAGALAEAVRVALED